MNPLADAAEIARAYDEDPAKAAAEYGAEFRTDIESFVSREAVDACIASGCRERLPASGIHYFGFCDPSGGSADSFTAAIAHRDKDGIAVLDAIRERRPPFSPEAVTAEFADFFKSYHITRIVGDHYGGEFPRELFRKHGIDYTTSERTKSQIYQEALSIINSGRCELLDDARMVSQLCALERRVSRAGRDSIDHPPGSHDDVVNSALGSLMLAVGKHQPLQISDEFLQRAHMKHGRMPSPASPRFSDTLLARARPSPGDAAIDEDAYPLGRLR
jgi:hypothetical protein